MPKFTNEKRSVMVDLMTRFDFSDLTPDQLKETRDDIKVLVLLAMDHDDDQNAVKLVKLLASMQIKKPH